MPRSSSPARRERRRPPAVKDKPRPRPQERTPEQPREQTPPPPREPFRVAFVAGSTPDKWAQRFRERSRRTLELVPVEESEQEQVVRDGRAHMVLARLPVDRDALHCIPLYDEQPVVVVALDHVVTVVDEVSTAELADEQLVLPERSGWRPTVGQLAWPPMSVADAVEVAASGAGVAVVPMSLARLHHRRDATFRPVTDLPATQIALVWPRDVDGPDVQTFIGVVRGRTARSSRD